METAVFARKKVRLDYRSSRAAVQNLVVEPHGLVSAGSDWYLCATSDKRVRFLKMARIRTATLLATPCTDHAVDVAAAWKRHRVRFLNRFTPVVVTGWLRADRWEDAREWAIRVDETEPGDDPPEGEWCPVSLEFMDDLHALTILLRLGPGIRVEAPSEIRAELLAHLDRIAGLYHR
jgi:transcriptional regulator